MLQINESISTAAGATHGQRLPPTALRAIARGACRQPVQRATDYKVLEEYALPATLSGGDSEEAAALFATEDAVEAAGWGGGDAEFGSFGRLTCVASGQCCTLPP